MREEHTVDNIDECRFKPTQVTSQHVQGPTPRRMTLDSANPDALYNMGTMLLRRGEAVPAARLLENAVLVRPNRIPSWNNLAKAYFLADLPELTVAAYEEVLQQDPSNAVAIKNLLLLADGAGPQGPGDIYRQRLRALQPGRAVNHASAGQIRAGSSPTWPVVAVRAGSSPQATAEDRRRLRERYPDSGEIPPNRFGSHFFMLETSEIYRAVSGQDLTGQDVDLELLGPRQKTQ